MAETLHFHLTFYLGIIKQWIQKEALQLTQTSYHDQTTLLFKDAAFVLHLQTDVYAKKMT